MKNCQRQPRQTKVLESICNKYSTKLDQTKLPNNMDLFDIRPPPKTDDDEFFVSQLAVSTKTRQTPPLGAKFIHINRSHSVEEIDKEVP